MAILLRDDFTGSGNLNARTPDGVNGGAWVNEPWNQGGTISSQTSISTGLLLTLGGTSSAWGAYAPLTGNPTDTYIESRITIGGYDGGWTVQLATCHTLSSNTFRAMVGVFQYSATSIGINYPLGPIVSGSDTVTGINALDFTIRAEFRGNSCKVFIDGALVLSTTITNVPLAGGGAYIDNNGNANAAGTLPRFAYVEAGTLSALPIFLDNFSGAAGVLSAHLADTGQNWTGTGAQAVLNGSGLAYCNTSNTSPNLISNAVIPQASMTVDVPIFVGTLPSPATYDYTDRLILAFWNRFDYSIELHSRDNTHGNAPRLYIGAVVDGAGLTLYDTAITANTSHTIRWDVVFGTSIGLWFDGVLVATATGAPRFQVGNTTLRGYFERYQDSGAPNQGAMLYADSIAINASAPPVIPPFWTALTGSRESI